MFSHLLNGFSKQSNNSTRLRRLWLLMEKSVQLNDLYWQTPKRPDKLNSYHFWLSSKNIQNLNWAISSWSFDFDCLLTRWHFYFLFFLSSWSNYKIIALLLLQVAPGVLSLSWQHQRHIPRSDMCNTHTPLRHHHSTSLFLFCLTTKNWWPGRKRRDQIIWPRFLVVVAWTFQVAEEGRKSLFLTACFHFGGDWKVTPSRSCGH